MKASFYILMSQTLGFLLQKAQKLLNGIKCRIPSDFFFNRKERDRSTGRRNFHSRWESVPVYTAEFEVLKQLTGFGLTRGMLCAMERLSLKSVEEV